MKQTTITSIEKFLAEITSKSDIDVIGLVTIADIDTDNPYESICEQIRDNNGFDIEIIYYGNAIEYLALNDCSLRESLEIASDMGYDVKNLNSEILASLHASANAESNFSRFENEINEFFADT